MGDVETHNYIRLHRMIIGGEPVHLDLDTKKLYLAGDELTIEQWRRFTGKIDRLWERYSK